MKKILVLMLVLAIASTASASLSFVSSSATVNVGETVVVGLTTTTAGASTLTNYVGYYASTVATLSVAKGADVTAGLDSVLTLGGGYAGYFKTVMGTTVPGGYSIGDEIAVATLTGEAAGTYTINVWSSGWTGTPEDSFTLTVLIPEPMTIGLLGLGGLFLRRRK